MTDFGSPCPAVTVPPKSYDRRAVTGGMTCLLSPPPIANETYLPAPSRSRASSATRPILQKHGARK